MENENIPVWMKMLISIFGLTFFFFLFAVFLNKTYDFGISGDSIIFTFVGIAATFIVVSNYAQVKDIERKFDEKTTEINQYISGYESKINDIGKKIIHNKCIHKIDTMTDIVISLKEAKEYQSCFYILFRALEILTSYDENEQFKIEIEGIVRRLCDIITSFEIKPGEIKIKISNDLTKKLIKRMDIVEKIIGSNTPTSIIIEYLNNNLQT